MLCNVEINIGHYLLLSLIKRIARAIIVCASIHLRYAIDDGVERLPDEAECGQIEEHVEHETTRTRVCMRAANHHVPLCVHVTKLDLQFAQYLRR